MLNPAAERFRAAIADKKFDEALTILARDLIQLKAEEITRLRATPIWNKWGALIPAISRQSKAIFELDRDLERYRRLSIPTLLLVGTATAAHHKAASAALAHVLPNVRTVYLEGEGHVACLTAPDLIAKAVSEFLQTSGGALPEGGEAKAAQ
jgi:pimeloyl-ACP methyl ester carboxylesterase